MIDPKKTLDGDYDDDRGGRRPARRQDLREVTRTMSQMSEWTHEQWQLLTKEDCFTVLDLIHTIQGQAQKYLKIRDQQSPVRGGRKS